MKEYRHAGDSIKICQKLLHQYIDTIPEKLKQIPESDFSAIPAPDKWSKKQILGHLIDSATNNHHRFIRAQFEDQPLILYPQNEWNRSGYYQDMDPSLLISLWETYNRFLLELIKRMPEEMLSRTCMMKDGSQRDLSWMFEDYVRHLEHHLRQIDPSFA